MLRACLLNLILEKRFSKDKLITHLTPAPLVARNSIKLQITAIRSGLLISLQTGAHQLSQKSVPPPHNILLSIAL